MYLTTAGDNVIAAAQSSDRIFCRWDGRLRNGYSSSGDNRVPAQCLRSADPESEGFSVPDEEEPTILTRHARATAPIDMTLRVTDVLRKIKGKWLIVHEHDSVPVDVATGKADLTSKP